MRMELLPEWARKYKRKGFDVRLKGNSYALYKVTSARVEGKKNPQPVQEYIGVITERDGLIERKRKASELSRGEPVEYGLSHFVYANLRQRLQRSLFNVKGDMATPIIKLGIAEYIYGSIDGRTLSMSWIGRGSEAELLAFYARSSKGRVSAVARRIGPMMESIFGDDAGFAVAALRQSVAIYDGAEMIAPPSYPKEAIAILGRRGLEA